MQQTRAYGWTPREVRVCVLQPVAVRSRGVNDDPLLVAAGASAAQLVQPLQDACQLRVADLLDRRDFVQQPAELTVRWGRQRRLAEKLPQPRPQVRRERRLGEVQDDEPERGSQLP